MPGDLVGEEAGTRTTGVTVLIQFRLSAITAFPIGGTAL